MVGDSARAGRCSAAMAAFFVAGVAVAYWAEAAGNPILRARRPRSPGRRQHGGQGGPLRPRDCRRSGRRSPPACPAARVNAMHDSLHAARRPRSRCSDPARRSICRAASAPASTACWSSRSLAVFVAGLMVGRTPEYLGKKIEAKEMKMAMLAVLILPLAILGFSAVATHAAVGARRASPTPGPHGLSEILYAYSSAAGNNGSAFAGLTANTPWYNTTLGLAHAARPLRLYRADDGDRRLAGRQDQGSRPRPAPSRPTAAVRRPAGRRDPDPRRPRTTSRRSRSARSSSTS